MEPHKVVHRSAAATATVRRTPDPNRNLYILREHPRLFFFLREARRSTDLWLGKLGGRGHCLGSQILRASALHRGPTPEQEPERVREGSDQPRKRPVRGHEGAQGAQRGPRRHSAVDRAPAES